MKQINKGVFNRFVFFFMFIIIFLIILNSKNFIFFFFTCKYLYCEFTYENDLNYEDQNNNIRNNKILFVLIKLFFLIQAIVTFYLLIIIKFICIVFILKSKKNKNSQK